MRFLKVLLLLLASMTFLLTACGGGSSGGGDKKGACIWGGAGSIGSKCWDDFTSGQCDQMNGKLYPGKTCADYGYTSN